MFIGLKLHFSRIQVLGEVWGYSGEGRQKPYVHTYRSMRLQNWRVYGTVKGVKQIRIRVGRSFSS